MVMREVAKRLVAESQIFNEIQRGFAGIRDPKQQELLYKIKGENIHHRAGVPENQT
jgi:hypothetical protein